MRLAIAKALDGVRWAVVVGAAVARDGRAQLRADVVLQTLDVSAHAEIVLRTAAAALGTVDLAGWRGVLDLRAVRESCSGACHWRTDADVYGASIDDSGGLGFGELRINNETMHRLGHSRIELVGGVLREECLAIFRTWTTGGAHGTC